MNKEEILKISRESSKDEGIENMEQRGRNLAFKVTSCIFVFEVILNMLTKQQSYGLCTLFFAYGVIEGMVRYSFLKKKSCLISIIVCVIVAIISLVSYILSVVR